MQSLIDQKRQIKIKRSNVLVVALVVIVAGMGISRVLIANQMVGASERMRILDREIQKVQSQNETLSEDLRQKESLANLETKANSQGFTKTNKYSFVLPQDPVAFDETLVNF